MSLIIDMAAEGLEAMALIVCPSLDASAVEVARPKGPGWVYISIFHPLMSGGLATFDDRLIGWPLIL